MNAPPPADARCGCPSWLQSVNPCDRRHSRRTAGTFAGLFPQVVSAMGLKLKIFCLVSDVYEPIAGLTGMIASQSVVVPPGCSESRSAFCRTTQDSQILPQTNKVAYCSISPRSNPHLLREDGGMRASIVQNLRGERNCNSSDPIPTRAFPNDEPPALGGLRAISIALTKFCDA